MAAETQRHYIPREWAKFTARMRELRGAMDAHQAREEAAQAATPIEVWQPPRDRKPPSGTFFDFTLLNQLNQTAESAVASSGEQGEGVVGSRARRSVGVAEEESAA